MADTLISPKGITKYHNDKNDYKLPFSQCHFFDSNLLVSNPQIKTCSFYLQSIDQQIHHL